MEKFNIYTKLKEKGYSGEENLETLLNWFFEKGIYIGFNWDYGPDGFKVQCTITMKNSPEQMFTNGEWYFNYLDSLESTIISCYDYI